MHLATRRVLLASCTTEPNDTWVTQQARNVSWRLEEDGIKLSVVIHDRDKKFARGADSVFKSEGARVILTPLMAPRANAHCERLVGSCRRECLDWMLIVSERHLQAVLDVYRAHYNGERPHRSCGLRPPTIRGDPLAPEVGEVGRRIRLAGLLSEYYREAVAA
jgi:hypothetical protein